jgi:hypothetical protein
MMNLAVPRGVRRQLPLLVAAAMVWSCASMIAVFDQQAYVNATTLKAEASALMDQATEPFANHAVEVRAFMTRVDAAYEYANGLPQNERSAGQWRILKNPEGNLLGGFLKLWKENGTLLKGDLEAIKGNVLAGFDEIIKLEAAKIKR